MESILTAESINIVDIGALCTDITTENYCYELISYCENHYINRWKKNSKKKERIFTGKRERESLECSHTKLFNLFVDLIVAHF